MSLTPFEPASSISEIAMKWGFNNFQHFSKLFRAHFGESPSQYRANQAGGIKLTH
ncbi:MAG: AraC family transcriptional regulator [Hyphomicrobiales bacterium]|nr:AraC family transcriptional regulator [Hyphomicrobiales bacterium]MCP5002156.1 AraC family transcriptional regulator [Hyphomicrobiales bacterium]